MKELLSIELLHFPLYFVDYKGDIEVRGTMCDDQGRQTLNYLQ